MAESVPTRVRTPKFRVSFPELFKATEYNGKTQFRLTALFPKDADLSALKAAAKAAAEARWGSKLPKGLAMPFKDGDLKADLDGYAGTIYLRLKANEDRPPAIVGADPRVRITNPREVYAGCYAYAVVNAFAYQHESGGPGVSFSFESVQKAGEGTPFGALPGDPTEDFEVLSDEDPIL